MERRYCLHKSQPTLFASFPRQCKSIGPYTVIWRRLQICRSCNYRWILGCHKSAGIPFEVLCKSSSALNSWAISLVTSSMFLREGSDTILPLYLFSIINTTPFYVHTAHCIHIMSSVCGLLNCEHISDILNNATENTNHYFHWLYVFTSLG